MNTERIKEIQQATAYPESVSVQQALLQVWNETEQEQLGIAAVISRFFKDKAKEHGVNEANLFIENRITHLSLCVFTEFESRVLEERINGL
jgi:hypothetical protein